ncbi:MAG: hypothetical protein IKX60_08665 [Bacteroidales bacterium]|nr:hypothetical protein [Bacteroidales bacterium]
MTTEKLDIVKTIKDGVRYGLKNFFPLFLMVILYVLTVWIPYLNVGTTIGFYKAIIGIGRGEVVDPVSIFSKDNFKDLGNFFLLMGFLYIGILAAAAFMFIPAIIMSIAWGFAIYFLIDKHVSPLKSLLLSYDSTFGNKWRIFFVGLLFGIVSCIICAILGFIPKVGPVLAVLAVLVLVAIMVAVEGVMYSFFSEKADAIIEERRAKFCRFHGPEAPAEPEAPEAEAPVAE